MCHRYLTAIPLEHPDKITINIQNYMDIRYATLINLGHTHTSGDFIVHIFYSA